eukprot:1604722-Alexandrium_andersonii.AAC.1
MAMPSASSWDMMACRRPTVALRRLKLTLAPYGSSKVNTLTVASERRDKGGVRGGGGRGACLLYTSPSPRD